MSEFRGLVVVLVLAVVTGFWCLAMDHFTRIEEAAISPSSPKRKTTSKKNTKTKKGAK